MPGSISNATVTLAHSRTADLAAEVAAADVLVAAVGKAEMIRGEWVKRGATVIEMSAMQFVDGCQRTRRTRSQMSEVSGLIADRCPLTSGLWFIPLVRR